MDKARMLAVKLLVRCEEQGYSNLVLKAALDKEPLEARDKQFISALVYGTLERQRLLDALLDLYLKKPCRRLDAPVRAILRSGLYQCRWMDTVPLYAAVNASVELTRKLGKSSAAGMVNAVLRKAAATDVKGLSFTDEKERCGTQYSVSDSIVSMLFAAYPGKAEQILQAFMTPAPVLLRTNTLRCTCGELIESLKADGITATPALPENAVVLPQGGNLAATDAFRRGWFHVQGAGSQLAALAVGARPGETVLDLCAAPGGKSVALAQQMQNTGRLICGEYQKNRVALLEKQLERCGVTCAVVRCADASVYEPSMPQADAVLCDVPCSGTGTLSKKPDIRYKELESGRAELTALQGRILSTAARYVRPGGRLIYSTCSLDPAENEAIVAAFLAHEQGFQPEKVDLGTFLCEERQFGTVLLPDAGRNDGFFIAKLRKV